jgi:hypothetical protein
VRLPPEGKPVAPHPLRKNVRLTGMNGRTALVCCLFFLPVRSFFRLRCLEI